jgi:uncharacterized protein with HEPN domain
MQRRDRLYLADIVEAADAIGRFLSRLDPSGKDGFIADDLVRSAVLQKLSVIGEAAARVSETTRRKHPETPWHQARGMRNLLVHAYFSVDWEIVWTTANDSVPKLAVQVDRVLNGEDTEFDS